MRYRGGRFGFVAVAVAGSVAVAISQSPGQQPSATGTGTLSGAVIEATSGAPIGGAKVTYSTDGNRSRTTVEADQAGRFTFAAVPAGRLFISAQKPGYTGGYYGVQHVFSANQYFEFDPGEKVTGVVLRMWGLASLSGRVTDESGKPVPGVSVVARRLRVVAGRLATQAGSSFQAVSTNEHGRFTVGGLTPTSYVLALVVPTHSVEVFYPSTLNVHESTVIELKSSEARTGLDFTLRPITSVPVSGMVDNRGSQIGLAVELVREQQPTGIASDLGSVTVNADYQDGSFKFPHVAPGRYIARVLKIPRASTSAGFQSMAITSSADGFSMAYGPGQELLPLAPVSVEPTLYGEVPVTVGEEPVQGVRLVLQPAGRIRGRVVFSGNGDPPTVDELARSAVMVMTRSGHVLPAMNVGPIDANLTFATVGLPPGMYALMVMPPRFMDPAQSGQANWLTRWANSHITQDVQPLGPGLIQVGSTDVAVTMTFSVEPMAGIQGIVSDVTGKTLPEASVFIVDADRRVWTAGAKGREVRPSRRGRYEASLSPGEYLVMASTSAPEFWDEADTLERLMRGATRVTLREGEKRSVDLRVAPGRLP